MEKHRLRLFRRLATGLVLFSLAGGWASDARAAIAYAFAEQTISNLSISPAIVPTTAVTITTSDGATVNGSGTSRSDALDVLQTYLGGAPPAPENFFARYAPGNPPVSPTVPTDFTRGDAAVPVPSGVGNNASVVSESYLNAANGTRTSETATSAVNASFSFRLADGSSALAISYHYANDIFTYTDGAQFSSADYHFNITIKDSTGAVIFSSSTPETNLSLVAPPPGGEIIRSGDQTVSTSPTLLAAGATYTLVFSIVSDTSVTAVPEPSVMAMLGVGGVFGLGYYRRSRRARAAA